MQKETTKISPTDSEKSTSESKSSSSYIEPTMQDMLLTDITPEKLSIIAEQLGVIYLSNATAFPGLFPVHGKVYGINRRLMINLVCSRPGRNAPAINIVFLVNTGSPVTYLSETAMEMLIGNAGSHLPQQLAVMIQSDVVIECNVAHHDKHFAGVNVLGADFLVENGLILSANYKKKICSLKMEENE